MDGFAVFLQNQRMLVWLIATAGCWFLLDFAYYGNTISTPEILALLNSRASLLENTLTQLATRQRPWWWPRRMPTCWWSAPVTVLPLSAWYSARSACASRQAPGARSRSSRHPRSRSYQGSSRPSLVKVPVGPPFGRVTAQTTLAAPCAADRPPLLVPSVFTGPGQTALTRMPSR
jgi:hypothetical protein